MAPDDSYISWTFDGPHRNLFMTRAGEKESWKVNISNAPGVNNFEVYHPRWSNDVRYMVMTGPHLGDNKIKLWDGADGVEIYIGKFDKEHRAMDGWLKLTDSRIGELFPDVWIAGGEQKSSKFNAVPVSTVTSLKPAQFLKSIFGEPYENVWPGTEPDCCFSGATTRITASSSMAPATRAAFVLEPRAVPASVPMGMHILGGAFVPDGTFNKEIRDACRKTDELAIEAIVTASRVPQFGPARIISLSKGPSKRNFTLGQEGDRLVLRLQTSNTSRNGMDFKLAQLEPDKPYHVLVTYKPGLLVCYWTENRQPDELCERIFRQVEWS